MSMSSTATPIQAEAKPAPLARLLNGLGARLNTAAADDDPGGIATCSRAGVRFGYQLGWTTVLACSLMRGIHQIGARPYGLVALLVVADILNTGADQGAMSAALRLLIDGPTVLYVAVFTMLSVMLPAAAP